MYNEILWWGRAEPLVRATALALAPVNIANIQGKCNLTATQAIQDIWCIMVNKEQNKTKQNVFFCANCLREERGVVKSS